MIGRGERGEMRGVVVVSDGWAIAKNKLAAELISTMMIFYTEEV